MDAGARCAGLTNSETADLMGFLQLSVGFIANGLEKKMSKQKYIVHTPEVRGEWKRATPISHSSRGLNKQWK